MALDETGTTPKQRLIERELGISVVEWVEAARAQGAASTWAELAVDLSRRSGERLSPETLRGWYARAREAVAP